MGLLDKIFGREKREGGVDVVDFGTIGVPLGGNEMQISVVYRCVTVISTAVASLPLRLYQCYSDGKKYLRGNDPMAYTLDRCPDKRMSRYTLMEALVSDVLLYGNGYAWVKRHNDAPAEIVYIPATYVSPIIKREVGVPFIDSYKVLGMSRRIEPRDMIHVLNHSVDGLTGISTISYAANAIKIAHGGEQQAADYYNGTGQPSGILTVTGAPLKKGQKDEIYRSWSNRMRHSKGGMVVLEGNMSYQQLSINPADAQLLESRQYSVVDICRFFGVSPVKCFDLSKSSYSTVEATQLAFLTDTLQPILNKIEQEIDRKYFLPSQSDYMVKFDTSELLRADMAARSNYFRSMVNIGAMTPNEVRDSMDLPPIGGGDDALVQTNMTTLKSMSNVKNEE